jgi:lipid-A-disaccharide synthase
VKDRGAIVRPLVVGIVAGESSGDQLGVRLMQSLRAQAPQGVQFVGVGGPLMTEAGLDSLFPMSDIAVNGLIPVIRRLPLLLRRMRDAADGLARSEPDAVIHIDAQDFNQRVASRLHRLRPVMPLIGYVSPTVWAWRPGRARKIARFYKALLAILPFEPDAHRRLGGPPTHYVGHPLMERLGDLKASRDDEVRRNAEPYQVLLLPGSRQGEIRQLLPLFADAVTQLRQRFPGLQVLLPAVPHLRAELVAATSRWPFPPTILDGEEAKLAAFRSARAALAASGTVTLELALASVPTVVAYRVSRIEGEIARRLITVTSASLPNLILGRKLLPEFIDRAWTGRDLADAVAAVLVDGTARDAQVQGFAEVRAIMGQGIDRPSETAASIVLDIIGKARR